MVGVFFPLVKISFWESSREESSLGASEGSLLIGDFVDSLGGSLGELSLGASLGASFEGSLRISFVDWLGVASFPGSSSLRGASLSLGTSFGDSLGRTSLDASFGSASGVPFEDSLVVPSLVTS